MQDKNKIQQALYDFDATIKAKPNLTDKELFSKFPEFANDVNKLQAAKDYSATLNSGKYKSVDDFNDKFPEFFSIEKKNLGISQYLPTQLPSVLQEGAKTVGGEIFKDISSRKLKTEENKLAQEEVPQKIKSTSIIENIPVPEKLLLGKEKQPIESTKAIKEEQKVFELQKQKQKDFNEAIENVIKKRKEETGGVLNEDFERNFLKNSYNSGDLVLTKDVSGKPKLIKATKGFLESFYNAVENKYQEGLNNEALAYSSKDEKIKYLNNRINFPDFYDKKEVPSGVLGHLGEFVGENIGFLGKAATAAAATTSGNLPSGTQTFAQFLTMLPEMTYGGYASALEKNYRLLKEQNPNISDEEALDKAENAATTGAIVGAGTAAALSGSLSQNILGKTPIPTISTNGVWNGIVNSAKHSVKAFPKVGGVSVAGSIVNDIASNAIGANVPLDEMSKNAFESAKEMAIMHFGLWGMTEPLKIPSYIRPQIENVVASAPREEVKNFYQQGEQNGIFPQGTTDKILTKLSEFDEQKAILANMPLSEEQKASIAGKLLQRKKLIEENNNLKKYGDSFSDKIKENDDKINQLDKETNGLSKTNDIFKYEKDNQTGEPADINKIKEGENIPIEEPQAPIVEEIKTEQPTVSEISPKQKEEAKKIVDELKSKNLTHVSGTGMGAKQAEGMYISTEKGNRYEREGKKANQVDVEIENPKVQDYVENGEMQHEKLNQLLDENKIEFKDISAEYKAQITDKYGNNPSNEQVTEWYRSKEGNKINEDYFEFSAREKAGKLITEQLKSEGYDSLYIPETNTTEGELIVFDRSKVKPKEETKTAERIVSKSTAGIEPIEVEGQKITTISGKTEQERLNDIEKRKKETKVSDKVKAENDLWQEAQILFNKNKNFLKSSEGLQQLNRLRIKARELGYEVDLKRNALVKKGKNGRIVKLKYNNKADSGSAINEKGIVLLDRPKEVQDVFNEFNELGIFLDAKRSDGIRMSAEQVEAAIQDILDGIPSNSANDYLDLLENSINNNLFVFYDKALGERGVRIEDIRDGLIEKEQSTIPMDENEFIDYLEKESQLSPEQEEQLLDNIENLLIEYETEPTVETGIETEIPKVESEAEKRVSTKIEPITEPTKTEPSKTIEKTEIEKPEVTGTKKVISETTRGNFNLPIVELPKLGTDIEILNEGKVLVESGKINPHDVVEKALTSDSIAISPEEEKAMQYYMYQLNEEAKRLENEIYNPNITQNELDILQEKSGQLSDMIDAATRANMKRGTAWSQFGNIRQIEVTHDYQPSADRVLIESSYGGKDKVPDYVKKQFEQAVKEAEEAKRKLKEIEEILKEKDAKNAIDKIKKEPKEKINHKQKRADLINKLKEEVEKAKQKQQNILKGAKLAGGGLGFNPTPEMLKIIGEIAADYVKEGYEKLEELVDKVHAEVSIIIPNISKKDIRDSLAIRESEKLKKRAEKIEEQIEENNINLYNKKIKSIFENNQEWVRQSQRLLNAKNKIKKLKIEALNSDKNKFQIGMKWLSKIFRASVLSGYNVLAKLASASTIGGALKRLPEQAIGKIYNKIFSRIAEKAPIEGTYAKMLGGFYSEFFNPKKFWRNTAQILKTGESELNIKMGKMPIEDLAEITMPGDQNNKIKDILKKGLKITDYTMSVPMNLHMVIKDPLKRGTFEASFNSGLQWADANGLDINDPLVVNSIENMAFKRANYEIFLENNKISDWLNKQKSVLEREHGNIGALSKTFIDFMIPVSTVPTNIVRRIFSTSPIGLSKGLYEIAQAYKKPIEELKTEEADAIMRQLKQGSLGTALWLIGWFGYSYFGGLYTKYDPNKKREMGDLKSDEMMVGGKMIPKPVQHALPFEIIQTAATARHIYNNYVENKGVTKFNAILNAGLGSIGALAEKVPIIETGVLMVEGLKDPYKGEKLQEDLARRFKPQILRELGVVGGKDIDKFIEKNTSVENVFKNELKYYNEKGQELPLNKDKFIEYKNKLKDNLVGRMSFLYLQGANILDDNNRIIHVSYEDLKEKYPEELNKIISSEKSKATKETKKLILGEKSMIKELKESISNTKLEIANEKREKQYIKSLKQ